VADGVGETTVTCTMSSVAKMHAAGLKFGTESKSALNRNNTMRGTMITMVPTMVNLTSSAPLKEGITQKGVLAPELQDVGNREV
jgi:hypothetical protein